MVTIQPLTIELMAIFIFENLKTNVFLLTSSGLFFAELFKQGVIVGSQQKCWLGASNSSSSSVSNKGTTSRCSAAESPGIMVKLDMLQAYFSLLPTEMTRVV